jgi:hypothetical protein
MFDAGQIHVRLKRAQALRLMIIKPIKRKRGCYIDTMLAPAPKEDNARARERVPTG